MKGKKTPGETSADSLTPDETRSVENEIELIRERLIELDRRLKIIERTSTANKVG